ncbi:MAG: 16S rRNA (cytosine(1402)-N(4))-methyltransferase RsmH [Planctomycetes bacterium]|jgi:16S rRNA (cytosine1402-N4)-methyltransferase|nr:16S rRNA (cytosine(1402)-N(4))-methyltransferase RsmH [Planctomycetota bacterium]
MNEQDRSDQGGRQPPPHRRRPRYQGTHPKSYAQKYKEHHLAAYPEIEAHLRAKGITPAGTHVPILVEEVMACLAPRPGEVVVDGTVGYGGHALEFIQRISPGGKLIGLDVDAAELERTRQRLGAAGVHVNLYRSNFAGLAKILRQERLDGFDIIFADLGVSSMQIDNPQRGMSYKHDGPLDMRMDDRLQETGADLLHRLSEQDLAQALRVLADEPDHEKISHLIVARRAVEPITRTAQLIRLVFEAKGLNPKTWRQQQRDARSHALHPAARTFQALRILVNDELGALRELLRVAPYCLRSGGRIGIISFHSGEDRLVKQSFRDGLRQGVYEAVAEDVIVPQREEVHANPRSASAKFRWARIGATGRPKRA